MHFNGKFLSNMIATKLEGNYSNAFARPSEPGRGPEGGNHPPLIFFILSAVEAKPSPKNGPSWIFRSFYGPADLVGPTQLVFRALK